MVDNGSSDETQAVLKHYCNQLPLKCVYEATAGLSAARNTGTSEADGDWLVWIDDDVVVTPAFLVAYLDAMQTHRYDQVLGGTILPRLLGEPPPWLRLGIEFVQDAFAARPPKLVEGEIRSGTLPYGANFALSRQAALNFPFDTSLGRHPEAPLRGEEELSVIRKVLASGATGHWVPRAVVEHCIEPFRQSEEYLSAYFLQSGRTAAYRKAEMHVAWRYGRCLDSFARWLGHRLEYALYSGDLNRARRARNLRERAWHWGYLCGTLGFDREHRSMSTLR